AAWLLQPTFASEAYPIQTPQSSVPTAPPRMYLQKSRADDLSKEAYIMDFLSTKVRFENDGRGSRDLEVLAALLSESAVHEFGVLIYPHTQPVSNPWKFNTCVFANRTVTLWKLLLPKRKNSIQP